MLLKLYKVNDHPIAVLWLWNMGLTADELRSTEVVEMWLSGIQVTHFWIGDKVKNTE